MSNFENDILKGSKDLKKMPYSVPEGYFEDFSARLRKRIRQEEKTLKVQPKKRQISPIQVVRYVAVAAVIAVVAALGITLASLKNRAVVPEDSFEDSDFIFYCSELVPATEPESIYYSYNSDSESLSEEDIINYLYYSGVDVDGFLNE